MKSLRASARPSKRGFVILNPFQEFGIIEAIPDGVEPYCDIVGNARGDRSVMRTWRAPPSAHLNVSGRAPAVNPPGVDCPRHAAAGAKPVCGWGLPLEGA